MAERAIVVIRREIASAVTRFRSDGGQRLITSRR